MLFLESMVPIPSFFCKISDITFVGRIFESKFTTAQITGTSFALIVIFLTKLLPNI
jgi:hypothetical protein